MSSRSQQYLARVLSRTAIGSHLVRLELGGDGLAGWRTSGTPDEWLGLVVPGQFQSRYYTVRDWRDGVLTVDVVLHESGLVTEWASTDCVGAEVTITEPKGSFAPPPDTRWVYLVGDLTAWPAMARIIDTVGDRLPVRTWAEGPERLPDYFPAPSATGELTWLETGPTGSGLATLVESLDWPDGPGYFWMAGESAQMRAIRKHLMHQSPLTAEQYDVMGYWRTRRGGRPTRTVDPGPIHRSGKARGLTDAEIWAEYDAARERAGE